MCFWPWPRQQQFQTGDSNFRLSRHTSGLVLVKNSCSMNDEDVTIDVVYNIWPSLIGFDFARQWLSDHFISWQLLTKMPSPKTMRFDFWPIPCEWCDKCRISVIPTMRMFYGFAEVWVVWAHSSYSCPGYEKRIGALEVKWRKCRRRPQTSRKITVAIRRIVKMNEQGKPHCSVKRVVAF